MGDHWRGEPVLLLQLAAVLGQPRRLGGLGEAEGAVNTVAVTDPIANVSLAPLTFGEAAINHDLAPDQSFTLNANTPNLTISLTFVDPRQPGAILVTKLRKHAADGPGNHPHSGVDITIDGVTKTTDANGQACFDGLVFGTYTVHETVPAGYVVDANDKSVTVDNTASCSDATYVGETVSFVNSPLTNITLSVDSQVDGGTSSTIDCGGGATGTTDPNGDGSVSRNDLPPGTYTCTVVIDP